MEVSGAYSSGYQGLLPLLQSESMLEHLDHAPDLNFLLQMMAPDYERARKKGILAVLEVSPW